MLLPVSSRHEVELSLLSDRLPPRREEAPHSLAADISSSGRSQAPLFPLLSFPPNSDLRPGVDQVSLFCVHRTQVSFLPETLNSRCVIVVH